MSNKKKSEVISNIFDEITPTATDGQDIWGATYLPVQWQNLLGKWEFPLEFWGGSMLEFDHEIVGVRHQSNVVDGFLLDSIHIAPFATKIHWGYRDKDTGKYIMAERPLDDVNPWRSRVHILALLKEAEDFTPVILTAGSNTGKHLMTNVHQGQRRISNMLKKIGYGDRPPHLFWIEMVAGKPISVGEGETTSTICPPVALSPANINKMTKQDITDYLISVYVGSDIRDVFQQDGLWDEGQEWAAKQPEQLLLDDGSAGGDNVALPPASTEAVVLVDGSLHIPDLSEAKESDWLDCAYSIPGLFSDRSHASRCFSKMLRDKFLTKASRADKWNAWKLELETLWSDWSDLQAFTESQ